MPLLGQNIWWSNNYVFIYYMYMYLLPRYSCNHGNTSWVNKSFKIVWGFEGTKAVACKCVREAIAPVVGEAQLCEGADKHLRPTPGMQIEEHQGKTSRWQDGSPPHLNVTSLRKAKHALTHSPPNKLLIAKCLVCFNFQTAWIQMRNRVTWRLFWIQSVCIWHFNCARWAKG